MHITNWECSFLQVWEIVYSKDGSVKEVLKVMQLKGHKVIYFSASIFWSSLFCFYVSPICQIMNVLLEKGKKEKKDLYLEFSWHWMWPSFIE